MNPPWTSRIFQSLQICWIILNMTCQNSKKLKNSMTPARLFPTTVPARYSFDGTEKRLKRLQREPAVVRIASQNGNRSNHTIPIQTLSMEFLNCRNKNVLHLRTQSCHSEH